MGPLSLYAHRRKGAQVGLVIVAVAPLGQVRQELYVASRWDLSCVDWNPHPAQSQWIATAVRSAHGRPGLVGQRH